MTADNDEDKKIFTKEFLRLLRKRQKDDSPQSSELISKKARVEKKKEKTQFLRLDSLSLVKTYRKSVYHNHAVT